MTSATGSYDLPAYCRGSCNTSAQQTAAFLSIAAKINAAGGGVLNIPAGYWSFDSSISGPMIYNTYGASVRGAGPGSTIVSVSHGRFAEWSAAYGRPNGGHAELSDLSIFESDVPTSGALILLDRVTFFDIANVVAGGGFITLDVASSQTVHGVNVTLQGDNATPGSKLLRVHRHDSTSAHPSEITFVNLNARGAGGRTVTNSIVINDADGLYFSNGHVGFASAEALLIQPENSSDRIDNFRSTGIDYDTASYGVRFEPYNGPDVYTGFVQQNTITGGLLELQDNDGLRVDDPNVKDLSLVGVSTTLNEHNGMSFMAGSYISITGGTNSCNNQSNGYYYHLSIGGKASYITTAAQIFRGGCIYAVPYNIAIGGEANHIMIGPSAYSQAQLGDVSNTSTGSENQVAPGVTDQSVTAWRH